MVHNGFDHKCIVNDSRHTKQVVCALRQLLVKPEVSAACVLLCAGVDDFQNQLRSHLALCHAQAGMFCQNDRQVKTQAMHYLAQLSFIPVTRLNTTFPAA